MDLREGKRIPEKNIYFCFIFLTKAFTVWISTNCGQFLKRQEYQTTSMVAQLVKNMPAMWETWVQSLDWKITWRREWPPTPIFWPGEFHGLYIPWGCKELDMTEQLSLSLYLLLRNLCEGHEATVRTDMEQQTASKLGKDVKAVYCHLAYLPYMQSTSC